MELPLWVVISIDASILTNNRAHKEKILRPVDACGNEKNVLAGDSDEELEVVESRVLLARELLGKKIRVIGIELTGCKNKD